MAITCSELLLSGGHVFLFSSTEYFGYWEAEKEEEEGEEDEEEDGKAALSFIVNKYYFTAIKAPRHYN